MASPIVLEQERHGYVYAFYNEELGWLKVGMTDKSSQDACRARINNYIRMNSLPHHGWRFICAIKFYDAVKVEAALHRRLRHFQVKHGKTKEIFSCSPDIFANFLDKERDLFDEKSASSSQIMVDLATKRNRRRDEEKRRQEIDEEKRLRVQEEWQVERNRRIQANKDANTDFENAEAEWIRVSSTWRKLHELNDARASKAFLWGAATFFLYLVAWNSTAKDTSVLFGISGTIALIICLFYIARQDKILQKIEAESKKLPQRPELSLPFPDIK